MNDRARRRGAVAARIANLSIVCAAVTPLLLVGAHELASAAPAARPVSAGRFVRIGDTLRDPGGERFEPTGLDFGGPQGWRPIATDGSVDRLGAWGVNLVRLERCTAADCAGVDDTALDATVEALTFRHVVVLVAPGPSPSASAAGLAAVAARYRGNPYVWLDVTTIVDTPADVTRVRRAAAACTVVVRRVGSAADGQPSLGDRTVDTRLGTVPLVEVAPAPPTPVDVATVTRALTGARTAGLGAVAPARSTVSPLVTGEGTYDQLDDLEHPTNLAPLGDALWQHTHQAGRPADEASHLAPIRVDATVASETFDARDVTSPVLPITAATADTTIVAGADGTAAAIGALDGARARWTPPAVALRHGVRYTLRVRARAAAIPGRLALQISDASTTGPAAPIVTASMWLGLGWTTGTVLVAVDADIHAFVAELSTRSPAGFVVDAIDIERVAPEPLAVTDRLRTEPTPHLAGGMHCDGTELSAADIGPAIPPTIWAVQPATAAIAGATLSVSGVTVGVEWAPSEAVVPGGRYRACATLGASSDGVDVTETIRQWDDAGSLLAEHVDSIVVDADEHTRVLPIVATGTHLSIRWSMGSGNLRVGNLTLAATNPP